MEMDFWETVQRFGPLGAALLLALLTNYRGMWLTKPNHEAIVKGKDERITSLEASLKATEAKWEAEVARLRQERADTVLLLRGERDRALALALEGWERAEHVLDLNGVPKPSSVPVARDRRRYGREGPP